MEKKDHVPEKNTSIPVVEDDTKSLKDPVMEKKSEDKKKQDHVPEKSTSILDEEDDTKSVKDPVMEKRAEDEKKQEHVPEESADITLKVSSMIPAPALVESNGHRFEDTASVTASAEKKPSLLD